MSNQTDSAREAPPVTRPVWLAPTCLCGHTGAEHGRSVGNLKINWGPCFTTGCDCRKFHDDGRSVL